MKKKYIELYPSKEISLEVRSFNERVIKFCKKSGFKVKEIYRKIIHIGDGEFIKMIFSY